MNPKKGIIGKKLGMTHVYDDDGARISVSVIEAGPCPVVGVRNPERDGYHALQIGFGKRSSRNVTKPLAGHCAQAGLDVDAIPAVIREIRSDNEPEQTPGDTLTTEIFEPGEFVDIVGKSKGRGFQGVVRRFGFRGGRASHGGGWLRRPGSIGMCEFPGKVYKGKKMPGRMGGRQQTIQNLKVVEVQSEENLILVKGAVPGARGSVVVVQSASKRS